MHGAPSGTGKAGVGPPSEDLDNILTRFQEWTRKGPSASKSGPPLGIGRSAPSKKVNLAAGARELSYEQALRATSYRRQSYQAPAQATPSPPPAAPAAAEFLDPGSGETAVNTTASAPAAKASSISLPKVQRSAAPRTARRARRTSTPLEEAAAAVAIKNAALDIPTQSPAERRKRARGAELKSPARTGGRNRTLRSDLAAVAPVGPAPVEPAKLQSATLPRAAMVQPAIAQPANVRPAFREVLQESAGLQATTKDSAKLENKTIALSLRVSDAEQVRIQACAARANVSVSAYLRQCALGVEELRDQVELALGELRKQDAPKTAPVGLSAIPRILRDATVRWFRKLRGSRDYTGISLR